MPLSLGFRRLLPCSLSDVDSDADGDRLSKVAIVFMVMVLVISMNALRDFFASVLGLLLQGWS